MEQLEKYFNTAFGAPDGIKKLRELILTLAMQGKLVPQVPKENSASQLLELITKEKASYWKSNKTKPLGPFGEIVSENVPYNVPPGWKWVRLGEVLLSITGGGTPSKNNAEYWRGSIPWASVKDLNVDTYLEKTIDSISEKAIKESSTNLIPKGSIIVCTRMGLGKIAINTIDVTINQDLKALKLSKYIDELFFINKFKEYKIVGKGVTVHGIRQDELLNFLFPLPPIEEQKRIMARINELYRRCDELEKLRAERDQKRLAVHTAAIRKMLDASDQETFDDAWQFITRHFGDLCTVRENVAELRKAILQLAVMGKLVKQDSRDEPASLLIKRIEKEKEDLLKIGKIKKISSLPPFTDKEMSFKIPKSWQWVRLSLVTLEQNQGVNTTTEGVKYSKIGFPVVQAGNISSGEVQLGMVNFVDDLTFKRLPNKYKPRKNEILYSNIGANFGVAAIVPEIGDFLISWNVLRLKISDFIHINYLRLWLNSPFIKDYAYSQVETSTVPFIGGKKIEMFCLPLPPAEEQIRIANKTEKLISLCDNLELQIYKLNEKHCEVLGVTMGLFA